MSNQSQPDQCSICLSSLNEPGRDVFTTACQHRFHFDCLLKSVSAQNHECPLCRTHLDALTRLVNARGTVTPPPMTPPITLPTTPSTTPPTTNAPILRVSTPRQGLWGTLKQSWTTFHGWMRPISSGSSDTDDVDQDQVRAIAARIEERRRRASNRTQEAQQVVATTTLEFQAQAFDQESNMFAMIKLKSPSILADTTDEKDLQELRVPADIVCVIDKSGSMAGDKIALLKETLNYLIDQLNPLDRLAIISFNTSAMNQSGGLKKMTPGAKNTLKRMIATQIQADGGTYIGSGLEMAIQMLNQRRTRNTVGALLLLTDGQDNQHHDYSQMMRRLPTDIVCHTFGYGLGHRADLLSQLAEQGNSGTFTFIDQIGNVSLAFATALGSLFTCVAQNIRVKVEFTNPYAVVRSHSVYEHEPNALPTSSVTFKLHDMNAEETRHLIFEIWVPKVNEASDEANVIGTVSLEYIDAINQSTIQTQPVPFTLKRPGQLSPTSPLRQVDYTLDIQRNRAETSRVLREAAQQPDFQHSRTMINEQLEKLRRSVSAQDPLCQQLIKDLEYQYENQQQFMTTMVNLSLQHGQERFTYGASTACSANLYMTSGQERFRSLVRRT